MATLYEGYTLCGLVKSANSSDSGIHGIELEGDTDHVVVTDSARSVTLYKVSDQKPLGSWTVKQGQCLSCPAVYNPTTGEYVAVSDGKVIRVWKAEDLLLDKAFKATLSSSVWRLHCAPAGGEPAVLFVRGAVRLLDALLTAPQQPVEEVLGEEEAIRWSTSIAVETQHFIVFSTEQKGSHFMYVQRLKPSSLQKFRLEPEGAGLTPLSYSACYREGHISLLYLYPNGHVYQSAVSLSSAPAEEAGAAVPLPRTQLLCLPVGGVPLEAAAALFLDDGHIAVVGAPHPAAGTGTNFLCIWNTNFQTLQAGKEMAGKLYGQLWQYAGRLFVPHGNSLTVIPYDCPQSSLASALGKLKHAGVKDGCRACDPQRGGGAPHACRRQDLQPLLGLLACSLVARSAAEPSFYAPRTLRTLVSTHCLCHSACPELLLLALERRDYVLVQLCLQSFTDVKTASLDTTSVSFMGEHFTQECDGSQLNGFTTAGGGRGGGDGRWHHDPEKTFNCPVGEHRAALLNDLLLTPYSDTSLLSHLKDLSPQHVMLFLEYLQFLYFWYSHGSFKQQDERRAPTLTQVMDWVCLLLDAHFTVLVMTPEARGLLLNLHSYVKSQVKFYSELGKLEGSLQEIQNMREEHHIGQYSIQVIKLF
ncbi:hypothetical protein CRUP_007522 [Coryphaenoides rupestris]|nr:hypothetical protein CRUP_007522 [Coryphaenoides rupestris]